MAKKALTIIAYGSPKLSASNVCLCAAAGSFTSSGHCVKSDPILDFLEFVEGQKRQSVRQLLNKILEKSRLLTSAEAGTIFIVRCRGKKKWLEPTSIQNDAVAVRRADFVVPIGPGTIAGTVAHSGQILLIDDVYKLPANKRYNFDPSREHKSYTTRSMLCFPLKNYQDEVIGVVQLINCRPQKRREPRPFPPRVVDLVTPMARVIGHSIERAQMLEKIKLQNTKLRERNRLLAAQRATIAALQEETEDAFRSSIRLVARAAEIHDEETGNHIVRVNEYSRLLATQLDLPKSWCDEIHFSAQLHDVGKMSVDIAILKKRGPLNVEERAEMDRHTVYGHHILSVSPRLSLGAEIALNHHEKWDGSGYPNKKRGKEIPLSARIVQIADVYDALRSKRAYKTAFSHQKTVKILTQGDDRLDPHAHFDPELLDLFARQHREFANIWERFRD